MPTGLDGNPDPFRTPARDAVLAEIATAIIQGRGAGRACVGIDGAAGTGKSTFADELAAALRARGQAVVRSTTDSFHQPRRVRYGRGRTSAQGYFRDSHDHDAIRRELLDPFMAGGAFRVATFDEPSDAPVECELQTADRDAVLVFDGLFLHRQELRSYWEYSVYLKAPGRLERVRADAAHRMPVEQFDGFLRRYVGGGDLYDSECSPEARATWVIDNDDLESPCLTRRTLP